MRAISGTIEGYFGCRWRYPYLILVGNLAIQNELLHSLDLKDLLHLPALDCLAKLVFLLFKGKVCLRLLVPARRGVNYRFRQDWVECRFRDIRTQLLSVPSSGMSCRFDTCETL